METDEKRRGKEAAALSGGHLCHVCGYQHPNPHPSAKLRRSHRKHCGKTAPAPAAVEEEEAFVEVPAGDREERNAGEQTLLGEKAREAEGKCDANEGAALLGSAREVGVSKEEKAFAEHASSNGTEVHHIICEISEIGQINCMNSEHCPDDKFINSELSKNGLVDCSKNFEFVNETNEAEFPVACTFESQNGAAKHCSELAPATVTNPAVREDSFDEYEDASPFLQIDPEDGALPSSEFPVETNNLNTVLSGSSVTADEISLGTNELCKYQVSRELNLNDLSAGSKVGNDLDKETCDLAEPEGSLKLGVPYGSYVNVGSNHIDMVDNEPDKRFYLSESIGYPDASSLQGSHSVVSNTDSRSTCSRNMKGVMEGTMHALDNMYEAPPRPESAETSNAQLETLIDSSTNIMPNRNELMVVHTENNPTDSTQNRPVKDTSDVQIPIEKLCQKKICSTAGSQNNLPPTTDVDDTLNSITSESCGDIDFTFQARTQRDTVEQVNVAEENPSLQKTSGFTEEEACNKQIHPEIPTEDQFHKSQKHAVSAMGQTSCTKNPFDLDDARNDDLFELPTGSYYLEVPSADVSRQEVDSVSLIVDQLTVSNQTRMAEAQHNNNSNDIQSAASSENSHPVGPKDMPVSSGAELVTNTGLADSSLDRHLQEDEAHTNGIPCVQYEVASMEFHTVCTHDTSALGTSVEEYTQTKGTTEEMTAVRTTDDVEVKQVADTTATNTYTINVEAKKVTEDTAAKGDEAQCCNVEQTLIDSTKDMSVVQSMSNLEENKMIEGPNTKEMNAQVNADDIECKWQTDDMEKLKAVGCTDNFEEKMVVQATSEKELISAQRTEKLDENKQTNTTVGQEGNNQREEIAVTGVRLNSGRIRVPLKVLLAEASAENKVSKPSAKERVLSFRRRVSKNDNLPAKSGSPRYGSVDQQWHSPAKLRSNDTDQSSEGRKQPWMPFICCHPER